MPARTQPKTATNAAAESSQPSDWKTSPEWLFVSLALFLAAAALRIAVARGELWLDEIWSIYLVANEVHSPADVVFRLHHDNNHILNSWVAYVIGPTGEAWQYRAPAVIAGIATVIFAFWAQRPRGYPAAFAALTLVGCSYLLIHYSSEARGYAYLACCLTLAYGAMVHADESERTSLELLFAASCVLGFLAHTLFLTFYLASQLWTWLPDRRRKIGSNGRSLIVKFFCRTLLPGMFFLWLYWVNLRKMQIGGGDPQPYFSVVAQTLSLSVGGAFQGPLCLLSALSAVAISVLAFRQMLHHSLSRAAFFATVIIVAPILLLVAAPRSDIYPRYFLGSVIFLYVLWSEWLGRMVARGPSGRGICAVILLLVTAANFAHVGRLLRSQRSHYREAIDFLEQSTAHPQVTLALDHGFRHGLVLSYLAAHTLLPKPLVFDPANQAAIDSAEWLLTHSLDPQSEPAAALRINGTNEFELVQTYPFAGLSGWQLNVYRRATASPK